jgi:tetratricopeptide (TPR) repeat protein
MLPGLAQRKTVDLQAGVRSLPCQTGGDPEECMPEKCARCGIESGIQGAFYASTTSTGITQKLCPVCWKKQQSRHDLEWLWISGAIALLAVLSVFTEVELSDESFSWFLLNLFLVQMAMLLSIVPHELGHAAAAKLLGMRLYQVLIGYGNVVFRRELGGVEFQIKSVPVAGAAVAAYPSGRWIRTRQFLFAFAGPLTNLLLMAAAWAVLDLNRFSPSAKLEPAAAIMGANAILLAVNLWPRTLITEHGLTGSDGSQMLGAFFLRAPELERLRMVYFIFEGNREREAGRFAEAAAWYQRGLDLFPQNPWLLSCAALSRMDLGDFQASRELYLKLRDAECPDPGFRFLILNNIAYANVVIGDPALLDEADELSREAMANLGWIPAIKGTRGAVLVELGRHDEGVPLLRESLESANDRRGKALNACHLALAAKRMGNLAECRRYLELARGFDPQCVLLDRVGA